MKAALADIANGTNNDVVKPIGCINDCTIGR